MSDGTCDVGFGHADLTTFCRLDELGLEVTGLRLEPDRAVLACRIVDPDDWCHRCGCRGVPRDTVIRRLAHEPLGWRPTTLEVMVRRYRCAGCGHVWRQDASRAAPTRAKLSRRGLRWALRRAAIGPSSRAATRSVNVVSAVRIAERTIRSTRPAVGGSICSARQRSSSASPTRSS